MAKEAVELAVKEPPVGLLGTLRNIGPGIVISGSVIGSGELIVTTTMGARHGFVFLWAVIICCVIKYFIQIELGRYCLINNCTTIQALNKVPGPKFRGTSWIVLIIFVGIALTMVALAGILGSVVGLFMTIFPRISAEVWAGIICISIIALLFRGLYSDIEKFVISLVAGFSLVVISLLFLIQGTEYSISLAQLKSGLLFKMPEGGGVIAISLMGAVGITAIELFMYPYWILEKGYASFIGGKHHYDNDRDGWIRRSKGWIGVMRADALICTGLATVITFAYYVIGAAVLHGLKVLPEGMDVVRDISSIFTETYGKWAYWLFTFGAFCTLYSTLTVCTAAVGRMWTDLSASLGFTVWDDEKARFKWIRFFQVFFLLLWLGFSLGIPRPVMLIVFGASANGLNLAVFAVGVLLIVRKVDKVDREVAMGRFSNFMLTFTTAITFIYFIYIILPVL